MRILDFRFLQSKTLYYDIDEKISIRALLPGVIILP